MHVIGVALICAVTIGFLLAGLATVGILVPIGWWSDLVVASSVASAVLLALFFNLKGSETPISPSLLECFPGGGIREDRSQESVGPFFGELA